MVRKIVRIAAILAACAVGVMWASPAFAYGPIAPAISTNVTTVGPDGSLIVSGQGYQPGESVTLVLFSTPVTLGTVPTDSQGSFSVPETLPAGTALGNHTIVGTGNTSGLSATTSIVVVAAGTATASSASSSGSSTSGSLAFTGADIAALAGVGAISLALGGMLVFAGRRRRLTSNDS
jgi:hypothetical protein